jgi:hypothetical protein
MILIPVFVLLLAGWILWAWTVAEDRNLKWLRIICAKLLIVIVFIGGAGIGVVATRIQLKSQHRADVTAFATEVRSQLQAGQQIPLLEQLNAVVDAPGEWSGESSDILERMTAATARLQDGSHHDDGVHRVAGDRQNARRN